MFLEIGIVIFFIFLLLMARSFRNDCCEENISSIDTYINKDVKKTVNNITGYTCENSICKVDENILFDNVYIINLEKRPDRWYKSLGRLKNIGIENPKKWSAVDASNIENLYDRTTKEITINEFACYLSHKNLWKNLYDKNVPYAIIFEDDLYFGDNISKQNIVDEINNSIKINMTLNFNILFLGYCFGTSIFSYPITKPGHGFCLHAYVITRGAMEQLLNKEDTFLKPIDHVTFQFCKNNICYLSHDVENKNKNLFGNGIILQDRIIESDIRDEYQVIKENETYDKYKFKNIENVKSVEERQKMLYENFSFNSSYKDDLEILEKIKNNGQPAYAPRVGII